MVVDYFRREIDGTDERCLEVMSAITSLAEKVNENLEASSSGLIVRSDAIR